MGVDGAIHKAAGPDLAIACRALGGCPTGEARLTDGYNLLAKHVIHTVGPVWRGGDQGEDDDLARCYRSALLIAQRESLISIAFPAISTGVYGFPLERAATIAVETVNEGLVSNQSPSRVIFAVFDAEAESVYREVAAFSFD